VRFNPAEIREFRRLACGLCLVGSLGVRRRPGLAWTGQATSCRTTNLRVMTDWFLHSKFKLACAAFLAALGLLIFGKMDSAQWTSFNTWLLGLYFGANVAEAAAVKKSVDTTP